MHSQALSYRVAETYSWFYCRRRRQLGNIDMLTLLLLQYPISDSLAKPRFHLLLFFPEIINDHHLKLPFVHFIIKLRLFPLQHGIWLPSVAERETLANHPEDESQH